VVRKTVIWVLAIVVIVFGWSAPAATADPSWPRYIGWKGCPAPQWPAQPQSGGAADGARVLVIGDSLTRESRVATIHRLQKDGWTPTIRCWGGKRLDWGIEQVQRAKQRKQLPATVVIALGTNDMRLIPRSITADRITTILDALGPDRQVLWVTTHLEGGMSQAGERERWFNAQLRAQAKNRPNLRLVEWAKSAREQKIRTRDGFHYQRTGYVARAEAIRMALLDVLTPAEIPATRAEVLQSN
jgi:lysophospholipase L1-like esterase